jgi:hypothetical protein
MDISRRGRRLWIRPHVTLIEGDVGGWHAPATIFGSSLSPILSEQQLSQTPGVASLWRANFAAVLVVLGSCTLARGVWRNKVLGITSSDATRCVTDDQHAVWGHRRRERRERWPIGARPVDGRFCIRCSRAGCPWMTRQASLRGLSNNTVLRTALCVAAAEISVGRFQGE